MTLSQISTKTGALMGAVAMSAALLFVAPQAHAAPKGAFYKIELKQPSAEPKQMLRGVMVRCDGNICRASEASTAPKHMCKIVARDVGVVTSFQAGERVFTADEVAQCNAK